MPDSARVGLRRARRPWLWAWAGRLLALVAGVSQLRAQGARADSVAAEASLGSVAAEAGLGVRDRGIFSDLDARVQLALPPGLTPSRVRAIVDLPRQQLVLYEREVPVKVYPLGGPARLSVGERSLSLRAGDRAELAPWLAPERLQVFDQRVELPPGDADDDGIPDPLDVRIGALKAALNADRYDGRYVSIGYPGGDVPREMGVCTDVIIRALRNAGRDLQRELQADLSRTPRAYPMIRRANPSIDHRRVKSLLPLFSRSYEQHTTALADPDDPLRAGDIVFMDTFPDRPGAEHVGIIADERGPSGLPLVINNWTDGHVTKAMDLLPWVPLTQRFRLPARIRDQGPIDVFRSQLVLVVSPSWQSSRAELRRYTRAPGQAWRAVGTAIPVVLGHAGYAWGDGLHGEAAPSGRAGPIKREGDGRSPAGVFELGRAFGYAEPRFAAPGLSYVDVDATHHCVDDPASRHYNQVLSTRDAPRDWRSSEVMRRSDALYELAIELAHNRDPVRPGHGSCIFVHVWAGPDVPLLGCTGLDERALRELAGWLRSDAAAWVALPQPEYLALKRAWGLP